LIARHLVVSETGGEIVETNVRRRKLLRDEVVCLLNSTLFRSPTFLPLIDIKTTTPC